MLVYYRSLWTGHPDCHLTQVSEVPMVSRCRDTQGRPGCPGLFTALPWPRRVPRWPSLYTQEPPRSPASSLTPLSSFSRSLQYSHVSGIRPPLSARSPGDSGAAWLQGASGQVAAVGQGDWLPGTSSGCTGIGKAADLPSACIPFTLL